MQQAAREGWIYISGAWISTGSIYLKKSVAPKHPNLKNNTAELLMFMDG
jgi:hypothetical protein